MERELSMALIIGRFQPLCNHHVAIFTEVVEKFTPQKLLLGIGVSGKIDDRNFLNFDEVKDLITPILENFNIDFKIRPIPDINNPPKYGKHVESIFTEMNEENTKIFTDNTYTSDCFVQYGHNYQIVVPTIFPGRATEVRRLMIENGDWKKYVPSHVAEYLEKNNCLNRLKNIQI